MNQEAFRTMLSTSKGSNAGNSRGPAFTKSRNVFAAKTGTKGTKSSNSTSTPAPDEPLVMKPRHIKPSAPIEKTQLHSLLRDLTGHDIDEADHPGSAKGLDFSLLNRAREQAAEVDDAVYEDELEAAFSGKGTDGAATAEPEPAESKTRRDILAKLKASRATVSHPAEAADSASKFRPIGFKPVVGSDVKKKKKKAEGAPDGERKKKKLKTTNTSSSGALPAEIKPAQASSSKLTPVPVVEATVDDDDDIFAGVDDYQGVDFGDSGDEAGESPGKVEKIPEVVGEGSRKRGWFDEEDPPEPAAGPDESHEPAEEGEEVEPIQEDKGQVEEDPSDAIRLRPLASSSIPSVRDILAADDAIALEEKRKARREKRKKARD